MLSVPRLRDLSGVVTSDDIVRIEFTRRFAYVFFRRWHDLDLKDILDYERRDQTGSISVLSSYSYVKHHRSLPGYGVPCDEVCLQRAWALEQLVPMMEEAERHDDMVVDEERRVVPISSTFTRTLREDKRQPEAMSAIIPALQRFSDYGGGCGMLCLPCGYGKTTMACAISCELRMKTLFIVSSVNGKNQFIEEAEASMENCKVGYIQRDHLPDPDCTHVVAVLQTLLSRGRDYFEEAAKLYEFGLVIVDECQSLPADEFSKIMGVTGGWTRLGLTATPQRADGEPIQFLVDSLGSVQFHCFRDRVEIDLVILQALYEGEYPQRFFQGRMVLDRGAMITSLADNDHFTRGLASILCSIVRSDPRRRVLVLCDRVQMCEAVLSMVNEEDPGLTTFFVMSESEKTARRREQNKAEEERVLQETGRKPKRKRVSKAEKEAQTREDRKLELSSNILAATMSLCAKEYNNPTLNVVVNLSWIKQASTTVQSTGRGLRLFVEGLRPVFIDIDWVNCRVAQKPLYDVRMPLYTGPQSEGGYDIPPNQTTFKTMDEGDQVVDFINRER